MARPGSSDGHPTELAYQIGFGVLAASGLLAAAVALAIPSARARVVDDTVAVPMA